MHLGGTLDFMAHLSLPGDGAREGPSPGVADLLLNAFDASQWLTTADLLPLLPFLFVFYDFPHFFLSFTLS